MAGKTNGSPRRGRPTNNTTAATFSSVDLMARRLAAKYLRNATSVRTLDIRRGKGQIDPRRNLNDECGYPEGYITPAEYQEVYDREPIPNRAVKALPKETWQVSPEIYEVEDPNVVTAFEADWQKVGRALAGSTFFKDEKGNRVMEAWSRLDQICGIGEYGVMLIGIDDGLELDQPAIFVVKPEDTELKPGPISKKGKFAKPVQKPKETKPTNKDIPTPVTKPQEAPGGTEAQPKEPKSTAVRKLMYLQIFPQSLVTIEAFDDDPNSPRFKQPEMYELIVDSAGVDEKTESPNTEKLRVHWTRIIHVADNIEHNEIRGVPRLKCIFNRQLDLIKIYGSSAEMWYQGGFGGLALETLPELGTEIEMDTEELQDMMERRNNGLQRDIYLEGIHANNLAKPIADPEKHVLVQIDATAIGLAMPKRILMGSERGELASSQDDAAWNDRLRYRQVFFVTPRIICPTIDRFIMLGVLSAPAEGYSVWWPDLTSQTKLEKADVAVKVAQAMSFYVSAGAESIMPPNVFFTSVVGMDEAEVESFVNEAAELAEEKAMKDAEAEMALTEEKIARGVMPDPTKPPPGAKPPPKPSFNQES